MTPREAKEIRKRHWYPSLPSSTDPHPLDGYSVAEFVKRCRSGAWTKPTRPGDPAKSGRTLAAKHGELTFEEISNA